MSSEATSIFFLKLSMFCSTKLLVIFTGGGTHFVSLKSQHSQVYKLLSTWKMVDAWGGWSLFQVMLKTLKKVASKHGVSIPVVAVRYILDQASVAGSMVGVRLGLSEHIQDTNAVFSLVLDEEDASRIEEVSKRGRDLLDIIGDSGDEYRRA
ncbi:hypothetical protein Taro_033254 [Colocasia esculenta]|uniref:NADP-dependent oxidoreductase domain-containing protein n=1 Tax=Colocasia esculenta TaxID=4460 RepID=A0A843VTE6_COLES|nr:hypothetical protein [Colocasia esculenta]